MKKIVCFGLCFMIVLSSFVLGFADGGSPVIIPQGTSGGFSVTFSNGSITYYASNNSPVYIVFYHGSSGDRVLAFSDVQYSRLYATTNNSTNSYGLINEYNGFYFTGSVSIAPEDRYFIDGTYSSDQDVIDYINNTVFSTTFDLTYLVDGSVSWLSSMAQAAKNNGLLLFLVTVSMVGIGIGLFNRFRR